MHLAQAPPPPVSLYSGCSRLQGRSRLQQARLLARLLAQLQGSSTSPLRTQGAQGAQHQAAPATGGGCHAAMQPLSQVDQS
jgi:hypothetical protein